MTRKGSFRKYISVLVVALITLSLNAQTTITEVINAFNAGAEQVNAGNFEAAIAKFEETIALADELGAEGDEMKANAKGQIPALNYRMALDTYKAKDIPGAIAKFEATVESCDKYGNEDIKGKSLKYIPQLYNARGGAQVKSDDLDGALASYEKAIEYKPDYARAIFGKALVYKKQDDQANMIATMKKAIEVGTAAGDETTTAAATKTLRDHYVNSGMIAFKAEDYDNAIKNFEASYAYDAENALPYYLTCVVYGKQEQYEKVVEFGLKAVQYEKEGRLGYKSGTSKRNAYTRLVDYAKSCDAYNGER